jgi:hypothetical protein
MRNFLIALSALAAIAASVLLVDAAPRFSPASGCGEASQLLACLNQAVGGLFGSGSSGNANVTVTPGGTSGVAAVNVTVTAANTAPTIVTITDSGITGGSVCLASLVGPAPATNSAPTISTVTPGTGTLTVVLGNPASTTTGAAVLNIAFWCFQ